jgi:hypothetical protein
MDLAKLARVMLYIAIFCVGATLGIVFGLLAGFATKC